MCRRLALAAAALSALTVACAPAPAAAPPASSSAGQSILSRSTPAHGSTIAGPLDKLDLWFDPPARLGEVIVTGPDGMMPMMVTAVGEVGHYSLPLPGLADGSYRVEWTATAAGAEQRGSFNFTVR